MEIVPKKNFGSFADKRGIIMWASQSLLDFDFKYVTVATIEPHCRRGDHYHKLCNEKFMCVLGKIELKLKNTENGRESITVLYPGDVADIPKLHTHTVLNDTDKIAVFIEFKEFEFDEKNPDTFK